MKIDAKELKDKGREREEEETETERERKRVPARSSALRFGI